MQFVTVGAVSFLRQRQSPESFQYRPRHLGRRFGHKRRGAHVKIVACKRAERNKEFLLVRTQARVAQVDRSPDTARLAVAPFERFQSPPLVAQKC